jgi:hypothetical protein
MSITAITVAKAIATAMKGEASIAGLYITAYGVAAQGVEAGVSLRDVADLVTKEGCKANKDTVSDWAMAAPLVADPTAWIAALESVYPGQHRRAHNLVGEVRMAKGRGVGKVRAILVPVVSLTDEATHEDRVKVIAKALRALKSEVDTAKAEARAAKKKADEGQEGEGQNGEGEEGEEGQEGQEGEETDPAERGTSLAAALVGPANALADALEIGDAILSPAERLALMYTLAALMKVLKSA